MADWYVSGTGNDTTGDGSAALPYRLPSKALSVASASDTIYVERGYTYAGTCSISLAGLTIRSYGSGALPILTNAAGFGIEVAAANVTLRELDSYNNGNHGLSLANGSSGEAWDCVFRENAGATSNGVRVADGAAGSFTFYRCVAHTNGNDGFSAFGTYVMTCYRCTAYGHAAGAATDGFTNHVSSAMRLWWCESYGNTRGVAFASDNASGASWLVGCYIHENTQREFTSDASGGGGVHVSPDFLIGSAFVHLADAVTSNHAVVSFSNSSKCFIWNCLGYQNNAHATNLYHTFNLTQTAAQSTYQASMGNCVCVFGSGVNANAYHVRVSTDVTGNVEAVKFIGYNFYDDDATNRFFNGAARSFTTWKTYPDSSGNLIDNAPVGTSYYADFTTGRPYTSLALIQSITGRSELLRKGTTLPSEVTDAGLNYDLFGHAITGSTPDIGPAQSRRGGITGVGGGTIFLLD